MDNSSVICKTFNNVKVTTVYRSFSITLTLFSSLGCYKLLWISINMFAIEPRGARCRNRKWDIYKEISGRRRTLIVFSCSLYYEQFLGRNVIFRREQVKVRWRAIPSWQMRATKMMTSSRVKHCVVAVEVITVRMNFGFVVIFVNGGSMENAWR